MTELLLPAPATDPPTLRIRPWPDSVIDTLGHDPRSLYVETFWLPTLGPTTLLLMRNLAHRFDEAPDADLIELPVAATAQALGLGPRQGRNSPLFRSIDRLLQFDLAFAKPDATLAVRRNLPPVARRHVRRLPDGVQEMHEDWMRRSDGPRQIAERRARRVAFLLAELGNDPDMIERSLHHLGYQPTVCREAAAWASTRHHEVERSVAAEARHPSSQDAA
ncbi:MAG: hypothetical protein HYU28_03140 [Actinobacteria bacterium]|nr:hypothetical protein [Actinomycetota bacterium]